MRRWKQREHRPAQPLSTWTITLWSVVVLGVGAAGFTVLWWRYHGAGSEVELDAIRTAGALTIAAGAAVGFGGAEFGKNAEFDGACVALTSLYVDGALNIDGVLSSLDALGVVLPTGWITRVAQPTEGEEEGWLYMVRDDDSSEQPATAVDDGDSQNGNATEA